MATLWERMRFALNVGTRAFRTGREGPNVLWKEAPFVWPDLRAGTPQYRMTEIQTYIEEGYNWNSLISSAVLYKSRSSMAAPMRGFTGDRNDPEPLPDTDPYQQLLRRPNPHQTGKELAAQIVTYFNIAGDVPVWGDRKRDGELPSEMYALRPDRLVLIPQGRNVIGFVYVPEGGDLERDGVPLLLEDVAFPKLPNPADPYEGMGRGFSPIMAGARTGDLDNRITDFLNLYFERGGYPLGILSIGHKLQQGEDERIRERWLERYGGSEKWVAPGVMDEGTTYQQITPSFDELGFDILDERNEARILGPLGVPGILINSKSGGEAGVWGTARQQARRQFWEEVMLPELDVIAEALTEMLGDENKWVAFDTTHTPALQSDVNEQIAAANQAFAMGVPRDDALALAGLPIPDSPDGKFVYMPAGLEVVADTATGELFKDPTEEPEIPALLKPYTEPGEPPDTDPDGEEDDSDAIPEPDDEDEKAIGFAEALALKKG